MDIIHTVFGLLLITTIAGADFAEYQRFVQQQANNETFVRLFNEHLKLFQDGDQYKTLRDVPSFPCQKFPMPEGNPTSVHKLRPGNVKVIAAIGDSITAGTGIKAATIIGLLKEDRGLSWSIGGDKTVTEVLTLANFLKVYNPGLQGYSVGWGPVWNEGVSRFNLANPGDKSENMPGQAKALVERMKNDKNVNFEEDWKIITVFVGGNDLCDFCEDNTQYNAEHYVANLKKALDYFHANVPRAFINMVQILDIAIVKALNANFVCDTLHFFLCKCAAFPADSEDEQRLQEETERYRNQLSDLIQSGIYDTRDDFTVVLQPFFSKTLPPSSEDGSPDLSYFAPDCFHLSLKGHQAAAEGLWNNMVEPVGKKRTTWTPGEAVECPSAEAPYFYTNKNSGNGDLKSREGLGRPVADKIPINQNQLPSDTDTAEHQSSYLPFSLIAVGTLVCVALLMVGLLIRKKRLRNQEERIMLFGSPDQPMPSYTANN